MRKEMKNEKIKNFAFWIVIFIFPLFIFSFQFAHADISTGLVSHYKLDETSGTTATDSAGTNTGSVTGATWTTGKLNNALNFDGIAGKRVDTNTNFGITGALTVSAWVYPRSAPSGVGRIAAGAYSYNSNPSLLRGWYLGEEYGSSDIFRFRIYDSAGNTAIANNTGFFANNLNKWTHVVGVFIPSQSVTLYVNGVQVGQDTTSIPSNIAYNATNFRIGSRADSTSQGMWNGLLDDIRIYSRALTAADITELYNYTGSGASSSSIQSSSVSGNTIILNSQTTYQTMIGWEAAADAALNNTNGVDPVKYKDQLFDLVVNDIGINQIQLGLFASAENSVDYWSQYYNSPKAQSDYDTWRANRHTTVNDDNNPNNINWSGFQFSRLDYEMDNIIVPLRQLLIAKGEQLHFNLRYVAYTQQSTGVPIGQKYDHDDPQEYAEFMLAVFLHLKNKYGFTPDALTIINEPDNSATREWYQAGARGTLIGQAIVATGNKLNQNGFSPRILAPETISIANASSADYFDKMINIPGVTQYLSEITYNRYVNSGNPDADLQALVNKAAQYGLDTGMHEYWASGNSYKTLHKDIKMGKNSSWQQGTLGGLKSWASPLYGTTPLYTIDDTDPNNPTLAISPMTKFTRQYYKFIRKGAIRIDAASNNTNFDPVAFVNTNGKYAVVVDANTGGTFYIKNLPAGNYGIKYTTLNQYDIDLTDQDISSGQALTANIPAAGVITIYGKTVQSAPAVTTNSATNITSTSATLNATVNNNGLTATVYFQYGLTTAYGNTSPAQTVSSLGNVAVNSSITNLSPSTVYYYRIAAQDRK